MRHLLSLSLALLVLGGCQSGTTVDGTEPRGQHGRYEGVGVFDASLGWRRMVGQEKSGDAHATLRDDDHVIVVVDSKTGEVRQCGDHSGYCVAMNPWSRGLAPAQQLPVELLPVDENMNIIEPGVAVNVTESSRK